MKQDQQDAMKKTENIQSLADQVKIRRGVASENREDAEGRIKRLLKKKTKIIYRVRLYPL